MFYQSTPTHPAHAAGPRGELLRPGWLTVERVAAPPTPPAPLEPEELSSPSLADARAKARAILARPLTAPQRAARDARDAEARAGRGKVIIPARFLEAVEAAMRVEERAERRSAGVAPESMNIPGTAPAGVQKRAEPREPEQGSNPRIVRDVFQAEPGRRLTIHKVAEELVAKGRGGHDPLSTARRAINWLRNARWPVLNARDVPGQSDDAEGYIFVPGAPPPARRGRARTRPDRAP